jgi:hypothetical protein
MKQGVFVRLLIPFSCPDGTLAYRVETRHIRLPLRREDREELDRRLSDS